MKQALSIVVLLLLCISNAVADGERDPALAGYFAAPLRIVTQSGNEHAFVVYLAVTPRQRAHGLMFVSDLPQDHGMLFLYDPVQQSSMWMKNTLISLDMVFIRADGTISSIATDTVPGSLQSVKSNEPVKGVLELKAGTARSLGISAGDRIVYRSFAATNADD